MKTVPVVGGACHFLCRVGGLPDLYKGTRKDDANRAPTGHQRPNNRGHQRVQPVFESNYKNQ